jgi:hypothetical protein
MFERCGQEAEIHLHLAADQIGYGRRITAIRYVSDLLASLNMASLTAGGFDFASADCSCWMQEAGFRDRRIEPLTCELSMVVGCK